MGYQFANNWPYSSSVFPSMDEHVDPVNNAYFTGLHTEINKIEYFLGFHPQGAYANVAEFLQTLLDILNPDAAEGFDDVKDKLENHGHTGGVDGKQLTVPIPGVWENIGFVGSTSYLEIETGITGGSTVGFAYFNIIYGSPCERSAGNRSITAFNTTTEDFNHQEVACPYQGRGALFNGTYGIITLGTSPGRILRFNPETWEEIQTDLDAGDNYPGFPVLVDGKIYGGTYTSPARMFRYDPSDHSHSSWAMDAGDNEILACCSDGTYIWACCNTDPVKLVRFKISDQTHISYVLTGFHPEVKYMFSHGGLVYMYSSHATVQWARFSPQTVGVQLFEPGWPAAVKSGCFADPMHLISLSSGSGGYIVQFDVTNFVFYISTVISGEGSFNGIRYTNEKFTCFWGNYKDIEAGITLISA